MALHVLWLRSWTGRVADWTVGSGTPRARWPPTGLLRPAAARAVGTPSCRQAVHILLLGNHAVIHSLSWHLIHKEKLENTVTEFLVGFFVAVYPLQLMVGKKNTTAITRCPINNTITKASFTTPNAPKTDITGMRQRNYTWAPEGTTQLRRSRLQQQSGNQSLCS